MTTMPYGERTDEILELARQVRTNALRNLAAMEAETDEPEDGHVDEGAQVPAGSGRHRRQAQVPRR